jgi:hypothetical protein
MDGEQAYVRIWKNMVVAYFKARFQHRPYDCTPKNKLESEQLATQLRFEPDIS